MAIHEVQFSSSNGRDTIKGWVYTPLQKPRAVVQIVHGFGEHSRRYMHMILRFLDAGFVVCADDHVAHGKTAFDAGTWGNPGDKGYRTTLNDEKTLHDLVVQKHPGLPYFMFGHSWGSMIARGYAATFGDDLTGLVLCGVAAQMKSVESIDRNAMHADIAAGKGAEDGTAYVMQLFAGMTDRYENPNGPNDWIALEPTVVADHGADPFNNFEAPTIQLMCDFIDLYDFIMADDWAANVPQKLPIYIISGDGDPVANYGEGAYHVANMLLGSGHKSVTTRIYTGYRHEIHNEPPIRNEVEQGVVDFIDGVLAT